MSDSNLRDQIGFYEKHARHFDTSITSLGCRENRNHSRKIESVSHAIGLTSAEAVLEVGTGTGLHAKWILENTQASYVGLDVSAEMLALARDRLASWRQRMRLTIGDGERLPFPDASFSAVFCSGTLHHMQNPSRGIAELARVVRPGGRVAAMEPNWKFPSVLAIAAFVRVERNTFKINPSALEQWARSAGLVDVTVKPILYTPPRPASLIRFFDRFDAAAARVPGLRSLSIMLLMSGTRP